MHTRLATLLMSSALTLATPALADSDSSNSGANNSGPPQQIVPPGNTGPNAGTAVIHPPTGVDPGINKGTPQQGGQSFPTPVLRPPGTPGGNPNVEPK